MKLVLTVTAVFDLGEEVTFVDINDKETDYGKHIVYKGHKIQPVIDFLEYQGKIDDTHTWEAPEEQINDELYDSLESEEYTIIEVEEENEEETH